MSFQRLFGNDSQVHGDTGVDIESVVRLGLVHIVSKAVLGISVGKFLVTERPQIEAAMSSEEVELFMKPSQWVA